MILEQLFGLQLTDPVNVTGAQLGQQFVRQLRMLVKLTETAVKLTELPFKLTATS